MADFLESARVVIEKWEKAMSENPDNLFLLNEAQCTQLWRNLRRVYDAFAPSFAYPGDIQQKCHTIFMDFYNIVVVRGGAIVAMCSSKESWLNAALFYGDNQRMFQELSVDLQSCADTAHQMTQFLLCKSHDHRPLRCVDNIVIRHDQADVDLRRDITRLKAKLEEHVQQPGLQEKEKSLAGYLLERENHRSSTDRHCMIQDPGSDESTIPSFFESANREYPKLGKNIARGGLDGVSVVEVEWLGLKCAKKEFLNVVSKETFAKEVDALVGLNHPNIVKLLCSRSEMPDPSFLMEFVDMSLFEFIKELKRNHTPIKIVPAVDLMLQMALGMEYLHGQGVVHRDLKSPNILVSPSPHPELRSLGYAAVKVTDFGLAKVEVFGPAVPTWKMRGTPYWIAPEAKDPIGRIDWRKADTYSFAITCLEILTCEVGRDSASANFPGECPIYLRKFLKKCGDPQNPNNRPSFEEIVGTLRSFKKHLLLGTAPIEQVPVKAVTLPAMRPVSYAKNIFRKLSGWGLVVLPHFDALPSLEVLPDPIENELYRIIIGDIRSGLEAVASLCAELNGHWLQQVKVCHVQCDHLAKEYLDGLEKVKSTFDHVSRVHMLHLFRSKKLQHFCRCLRRLGSSVLAATKLLKKCGSRNGIDCFSDQWPLMALAISLPLPPNGITYSGFGRCLLELYWNLYVIHHTLHDARPHASEMTPQLLFTRSKLRIEWCNQSCKLILRGDTLDTGGAENGVAKDEFLAQDAERQQLDREALWQSVNMSSISLSHEDNIDLPEFEEVLRKRLQSTWESVNESRLARTSAPQQDCYFLSVPWYNMSRWYVSAADLLRATPLKHEHCFRWFGAGILRYTDSTCHYAFFTSRFLAEVEALARVQVHPSIVQFLGYAYDVKKRDVRYHSYVRGHFFLTEPLGTPLFFPARRRSIYFHGLPFPLRFTVGMLLQIAEGMMHVHECGVLHRNLNPSNIMYEYTDGSKMMRSKGFHHVEAGFCTLRVTGFDSAVTLESRRPLSSSDRFYSEGPVGIFPFMAPEIWKGSLAGEGYTWSVDVWSFGMVASFILTGSFPEVRGHLRGGDMVQRKDWTSVLEEDELVLLREVREDCPIHLTKLIKRCSSRKPEARPSFEQIWKELWTIQKDLDMSF